MGFMHVKAEDLRKNSENWNLRITELSICISDELLGENIGWLKFAVLCSRIIVMLLEHFSLFAPLYTVISLTLRHQPHHSLKPILTIEGGYFIN